MLCHRSCGICMHRNGVRLLPYSWTTGDAWMTMCQALPCTGFIAVRSRFCMPLLSSSRGLQQRPRLTCHPRAHAHCARLHRITLENTCSQQTAICCYYWSRTFHLPSASGGGIAHKPWTLGGPAGWNRKYQPHIDHWVACQRRNRK